MTEQRLVIKNVDPVQRDALEEQLKQVTDALRNLPDSLTLRLRLPDGGVQVQTKPVLVEVLRTQRRRKSLKFPFKKQLEHALEAKYRPLLLRRTWGVFKTATSL